MPFTPISYQKIVVGTSFVVLSSQIYTNDAVQARLTIETTDARFAFAPMIPSTIEGHLLQANVATPPLILSGLAEIAKFRVISSTTVSATLICSYSVLG